MRTLLAALLLTAVAAAQSFDELLPDSTILYVSVENVARMKERLEKSPLMGLWKDEAMQAFLEKPRAKWSEWMTEIQKQGEFTPEDVLDVLAGQWAFALTWKEGDDEPEVLLLADIGENAAKLNDLVAKLEKLGAEKGDRRDEEEFRGVKIVRYSRAGEGEERKDSGAWLLDGKTFVMTQKAELLKDVVARKERKEGTLAMREIYRNARARAGGRAPDFLVYADGANLLKALVDTEEIDEEGLAIAGALGLSAIEALEFDVTLEPNALVARGFLAVKGAKTGILKLLDGKNSALVPARYAPADALSAGAFALDVPVLYEEFRKILDGIEEGATAEMDEEMKATKEQTGVDIAADMIATAGAEFTYHIRPPGDAAFGPAAMLGRFTLALQVKDRERLEGAIDKLIAAYAPDVATQEYLGVKLRTIPTPMGVQPAMAVLPDRFVFALATEDLQDVVARYGKETKGFLDREDVAKAIAQLPPQRFAVGIEDVPKSMSASMSALGMTLRMLGGRQGAAVAGLVDFSLFPSAEVLSKYLGLSASCLVNEEDGVSYVSMFHLAPAKE